MQDAASIKGGKRKGGPAGRNVKREREKGKFMTEEGATLKSKRTTPRKQIRVVVGMECVYTYFTCNPYRTVYQGGAKVGKRVAGLGWAGRIWSGWIVVSYGRAATASANSCHLYVCT